MKILIKGYYGQGNLGDDILMICSYHLIKSFYPHAEIYIFSESKNSSYIHKLVKDKVHIIGSKNTLFFDLIFDGGGGVFFDFKEGGFKYLLLNNLIRFVGIGAFSKLFHLYKKISRSEYYLNSAKRVGMGIGIGTYCNSAQKFYVGAVTLNSYNALFVRDNESVTNLNKIGVNTPVYVSTDLAFLSEFWKPERITPSNGAATRIGIVLRDWPFGDNNFFSKIKEVINELLKKGMQIRLYSFDKNTDIEFIKEFGNDVYVWDPDTMNLEDYLEDFSKNEIIISSRAHGAILGGVLQIPTICLAIEPKLVNVSKMFPRSSCLVNLDFGPNELIEKINSILEDYQKYKLGVRLDIEENKNKIEEAKNLFGKVMSGIN